MESKKPQQAQPSQKDTRDDRPACVSCGHRPSDGSSLIPSREGPHCLVCEIL